MALRTTGVRYELIARDSASREFDRVGRSAAGLERGMGRLGRSVGLIGAALGAAGLGAVLGESAKKAVEFQTSMKLIQTQAGGTAKDVSVLSKGVLNLGKYAEQGPQQLSEAMYHLKSVGLDNVSALKDLKVASDLAAVGGSGLEDTTNALAGAWRSGIKGADTFSKAASTVNAVLGAGNMRMSDFVEAIGTGILPAAKSFGLSLNQVGAALALMTDEGIPAVDAANRLRMSFSLLGAPSGAAEKQLKKIGLTGLDLANAMRGPQGLIGAVGLLKDHLDKSGLSAAQASQLLSRAFGGGRSSSGILTLINNFDVLKLKQDQVNSSMGKFPAAVAAQRKTAEAQLKILESNLDVLAIQIGTKTLPVLSGFVQFLNKTALPALAGFGNAFLHLIPVDQIKAGFTTVEGLVSDFLAGFNPKTPKKQTITLPTPTLKVAGTPISPYVKAPGIRLPTPTLEVPTTPIPGTLKAPAAVKSQATKLGEELRKAFAGGIGDAIGRIDWGKLGKQIGDGLGKAIQWLTIHIGEIAQKLEKALSTIDWVNVGKSVGGQALGFTVGFLASFATDLTKPSFWKKHWWDFIWAALAVTGVGEGAGQLAKIFEKIPVLKAIAPFLKRIESLASPISKAVKGVFKGLGAIVKAIGAGFLDGLERVFPGMGEAVSRKLDSLVLNIFGYWARFGAAGLRLIDGLKNGILKGGATVGRPIGQVVGWVLKPFAKAGGWLLRAGGDLLSGLKTGILDGAKGIGRWLNDHLVRPVVDWVKSLFGIHSPSTVFATIGRNLVYGLTGGIAAAIAGIGRWLYSHVISPILGAFSGAGDWLYGRGQAVVGGLKNGAWSVGRGIGDWATGHIADPVIGAFSGAGGWLVRAGLDLMSGLESGIQSGFSHVLGLIGTLTSNIKRSLTNITGDVGGIIGKIHLGGLASGGTAPIGTTTWVGESGPELMRVGRHGTRIFSHRQSMALAGALGVAIPRSTGSARGADMMAAVRARTGTAVRPAAGGRTTVVSPVVHVHFSDPKLRDLIRIEVENGHVELTEALRAGGAA